MLNDGNEELVINCSTIYNCCSLSWQRLRTDQISSLLFSINSVHIACTVNNWHTTSVIGLIGVVNQLTNCQSTFIAQFKPRSSSGGQVPDKLSVYFYWPIQARSSSGGQASDKLSVHISCPTQTSFKFVTQFLNAHLWPNFSNLNLKLSHILVLAKAKFVHRS